MGLGSNCFDEGDWRLKRMFAAVGKKGRLIRNSAGRFEMEGTDIEFTCGSGCEVYAPYFSDEDERMTWLPTSIEYSGDYYFTARPDIWQKSHRDDDVIIKRNLSGFQQK